MSRQTKVKVPICLCGCGGSTKGGRFLPGHDAKLKKTLVAGARAGKKRAVNKLAKLGWSKFIERTQETNSTPIAVSDKIPAAECH